MTIFCNIPRSVAPICVSTHFHSATYLKLHCSFGEAFMFDIFIAFSVDLMFLHARSFLLFILLGDSVKI